MKIYQFLRYVGCRFVATVFIVFCAGNLHAQHIFSVNYGNVSQDTITLIKRYGTSALAKPITKNSNDKEVYLFSLASVHNTKIVILNEKTGKSVVITPAENFSAQFELSPFFIEEIKQAILGDAERYLVAETNVDFSIRNVVSISAKNQEVFIPRYFYGQKETMKEALPKDRQIVHIFKEKPKLIPALPNDPENLRFVAELEEKMSYYVYMYQLPDGTLAIYDEHFNPNGEKNVTNTKKRINPCCSYLEFNLSGTLTQQQQSATEYALELWSEQLGGTVPIDITTSFVPMAIGILGSSYTMPTYLFNNTWYCSTLGNQLAGYNVDNLYDIRIEMNSYYSSNFYYGLDGNAGNLTDWVTVMLHEITHGLGFYSNCMQDGRYYYVASNGNGYYDNSNRPTIFDRQLYQGKAGNVCLTDLNQSQRAALMISDNLYAGNSSSHLLAVNDGMRVKMYAPPTWQQGSSVSHWDNNHGFPNFMQYAYQYPLHSFNARKIGILFDMGWELPCSNSVLYVTPPAYTNITTPLSPIINDCGDIFVEDVQVKNGGGLLLEAPNGTVKINSNFKMEAGSTLKIQ